MKVAEEKLDQETVAQANERLARMNLGAGAMQGIGPAALALTTEAAPQKSARAPRKDKGTRRVKAAEPPAQARVFTKDHKAQIWALIYKIEEARVHLCDSTDELDSAEAALSRYLDSLTQQ